MAFSRAACHMGVMIIPTAEITGGKLGEPTMQNQINAATIPVLSTVKNLPEFFPALGLTHAAIQGQIFKADDRINSRGETIPGNGLAATGAIIRRGRKVLIDVQKYGAWLSGSVV